MKSTALRFAIFLFGGGVVSLVPRAAALYAKPSAYPPYGDAGAQFVTDTNNRCPPTAIANFHAAAANTIWEYEFSPPFKEAKRGAVHSGELRYIFGMFLSGPGGRFGT